MITRLCSRFYFAVEAIQSVEGHKPPTLADTPAGRYAGSLFSSASQKQCLNVVLKDMKHLKAVINSDPSITEFLKNSSVKRSQQREILGSINQNYSEISNNFIDTVIEGGRLADLPKMIQTYISYCKILNKEEDIKIISAKQLSNEQRDQVLAAVKKNKPDVRFKVTYEVDPAILGGLQIFAGTQFLDCSLRSRIARLKSELARIV